MEEKKISKINETYLKSAIKKTVAHEVEENTLPSDLESLSTYKEDELPYYLIISPNGMVFENKKLDNFLALILKTCADKFFDDSVVIAKHTSFGTSKKMTDCTEIVHHDNFIEASFPKDTVNDWDFYQYLVQFGDDNPSPVEIIKFMVFLATTLKNNNYNGFSFALSDIMWNGQYPLNMDLYARLRGKNKCTWTTGQVTTLYMSFSAIGFNSWRLFGQLCKTLGINTVDAILETDFRGVTSGWSTMGQTVVSQLNTSKLSEVMYFMDQSGTQVNMNSFRQSNSRAEMFTSVVAITGKRGIGDNYSLIMISNPTGYANYKIQYYYSKTELTPFNGSNIDSTAKQVGLLIALSEVDNLEDFCEKYPGIIGYFRLNQRVGIRGEAAGDTKYFREAVEKYKTEFKKQ